MNAVRPDQLERLDATTAAVPFDESLPRLYIAATTAAVVNARRWQRSREKTTRLETALTSRAEIDQAKGVLMALHGCTADEAFARLVEQSQHDNVKVNQLARDLLASIRSRGDHAGSST